MEKIVVIKPSNKGLKEYAEKALSFFDSYRNKEIIVARGEDIPFIVEKLAKQKIKVFGIVGEDLFKEYTLDKESSVLFIVKKIEWNDKRALLGKPVLCLLGPSGKNIDSMLQKIKVCINAKYKNISNNYLKTLEAKGFILEKVYVNGQTENFIGKIADLAIDIVYSGSTIKELGISIYDKIFSSDFIIIGGKND